MLLWGDEAGDIHILEFKAPVTQLFEKAFTKQTTKHSKNRIYMHVRIIWVLPAQYWKGKEKRPIIFDTEYLVATPKIIEIMCVFT